MTRITQHLTTFAARMRDTYFATDDEVNRIVAVALHTITRPLRRRR